MAKSITFDIPESVELLAAIGKIALRQEHLNYILRMTIRDLANLDIQEALDATSYDTSRQLRDRIKKLARQELGEGQALLKLQALLERCRRATEVRNELVHNVWGRELDGEGVMKSSNHEWQPQPTAADLEKVFEELSELIFELNSARLDGYIHQALAKRRSSPEQASRAQ